MKFRLCLFLVGAITLALTSLDARAGFTTVHASKFPGEANHAELLGDVFGGSFTANGMNFSNGSITATRVDDGMDAEIGATSGTKVAGESSLEHTFEFTDGKFVATSSVGTYSSDMSANADGRDHVLTYQLSGAQDGWLLFFEDGNGLKGADFDFNDLVVHIDGATAAVPLPTAALMGAVGLVVVATQRRLRRKVAA